MFARHRVDPAHWNAARLAAHYDTSECDAAVILTPPQHPIPLPLPHFTVTEPEWVAAILESCSPPIYVAVDGAAYGVAAVRPMADYEVEAAAAAAEADRVPAESVDDRVVADAAPSPSFASLSQATAAQPRASTLAQAAAVATAALSSRPVGAADVAGQQSNATPSAPAPTFIGARRRQ